MSQSVLSIGARKGLRFYSIFTTPDSPLMGHLFDNLRRTNEALWPSFIKGDAIFFAAVWQKCDLEDLALSIADFDTETHVNIIESQLHRYLNAFRNQK